MAMVRQLLFIWVAIYSQIRLYMQNILILIIIYYQITTVIIKISDQNIVIWESISQLINSNWCITAIVQLPVLVNYQQNAMCTYNPKNNDFFSSESL